MSDPDPQSPCGHEPLIAQLMAQIETLTSRVAQLEAQLAKNSRNSSKPPSSDNPFTKAPPRSLRGKSTRRPGKQPGQPGAQLRARADPDRVVVHAPDRCGSCGGGLGDAPVVAQEARQVFDVPPVRLEVVEHRVQRRRCGCGQVSTARFPDQASAPTCYGPGVAALGTYLLARQHLPVARTAELMSECLGAPVSVGWLAGLLPAAARGLTQFEDSVRAQLQAAPVAHFDETGARVAGKLRWVHVACTEELTAYHRAPARGESSMDLGGVLPTFAGVAIHDGLSSYRHYATAHGLCNAHHLRELTALQESFDKQHDKQHDKQGDQQGIDWPGLMASLLVEIHTGVNHAKDHHQTRLPARKLARYQRHYRALIARGQKAHPPPAPTGKKGRPKLGVARSLLRRLEIYQADVLRFATDFAVPFDNNQAERDIRMIKLQQKISGSWRTETGADAFLTVRSYLSTARKQHHAALDVLRDLFTGNTWIPTAAH